MSCSSTKSVQNMCKTDIQMSLFSRALPMYEVGASARGSPTGRTIAEISRKIIVRHEFEKAACTPPCNHHKPEEPWHNAIPSYINSMDVHRARFIPYPTSAISALAFSRTSDSGYTGPPPALKLALGRANGDIEIWNPQRGLWVQETIFPGNGARIDGLAWTQDPDEKDADGEVVTVGQMRLFSIASSPSVTEWDLATGRVKRVSTGNFSEVWCLAAQPRLKGEKSRDGEVKTQDLVAGCGDGTMVLLATEEGDLVFKRFLARVAGKKARCMCVSWQSLEKVVAGFADGMIRVWDTRNGSLLRTMSLGSSVPGAPKNALVWQVRCLPNGDIVSGDSNGEVKIWDGRTYSMLQKLNGHDSDCLDLVVGSDGRTMMSGSIDGKIAIYRQSSNERGRKTWARNGQRRLHNGEVNAMAAFDSRNMSVAVTGGSDASPMVTPLREYGKENPRSLPTLPRHPPVASAKRARLLVSWWDQTVMVWKLAKRSNVSLGEEQRKSRKLVAKIDLDTTSAIRSAAITPDGKILGISTSMETKAFQLQQRADNETLAVRKMTLPKDISSSGARVLSVSSNGKWLSAVTLDNEVYVARLAAVAERPKYLQVLSKPVELERRHRPVERTAFKEYDRAIDQVAFSPDSSVLVVSDLAGFIDSWVLEGHEDVTAPAVDTARKESRRASSDNGDQSDSDSSDDSSDDDDATTVFYGQHWTDNPSGHLLPRLQAPALLLTFRPPTETYPLLNGNPGVHPTRHNPHAHSHELPPGQHRLFVLTSKHQIYEFDVLAGRLSDWSRRNPTPALPEAFSKIRDRVMGAVWDASKQRQRIWLYGSNFVTMLDVGADLDGEGTGRKRRKAKGGGDEDKTARKRLRLESGAGSRKFGNGGGSGAEIKKYEDGTLVEWKAGREDERADGDDEEDDEDVDLRLTRVPSDGEQQLTTNGVASAQHSERRWWSTFKYRPILGMVEIENDEAADGEPVEVVIVERPAWDSQHGGR